MNRDEVALLERRIQIETVDKAAEIYIKTKDIKKYDGLSSDDLVQMCKHLNVTPRVGILGEHQQPVDGEE